MKINYNNCKKILQNDFSKENDLNKLLKYKVFLIDSNRYINKPENYGLKEDSISKGFIIEIPEISKDSYVPRDKFMELNIKNALEIIERRVHQLTDLESNMEQFGSGKYKGIYYSVIPDCCENIGGYFVELYKITDDLLGDIDFDQRLDYMVIHADNKYEMENPEKVVEYYIDRFLKEIESENQEEIM